MPMDMKVHNKAALRTIPPVEDCWVMRRAKQDGRDQWQLGYIVDRRQEADGRWQVAVCWNGRFPPVWERFETLQCGFQRDHVVQHVPLSTTRKSLGLGTVLGTRHLAGHQQVLVQLHETGQSLWLPFERLRRVQCARMRYERQQMQHDDAAERFRLKFLAHALESWNRITGALDRLDVDPLPHQIHLVHHILSSGNWNWLIADDVGLGKTIEVGLLLAALKRQGHARRVLIVCPAGLVRQWQDEMKYKFGQEYLIYGHDFMVNDPAHWKLRDHVIVSLDRAKQPEHMDIFRNAPGWDMVIFDEAHKLSRHYTGKTQRYRLAEMLRGMTDSMLLLTATPHQGYEDRFRNLLKLVRPDLRHQIDHLKFNPEIVSDIILRNRKSQVTDAQGRFIFRGLQVKRVSVPLSPHMQNFDRALRRYLRQGYRVAEQGGMQERAIGFVMTTFRKLASSSVAAIERALRKRLEKLVHLRQHQHEALLGLDEEEELELLQGNDEQDDEEKLLEKASAAPFFEDEAKQVQGLLKLLRAARDDDRKLRTFLDEIVEPLRREGRKLLIFTEYRGTQEYLREALQERFPHLPPPALINGSMKLDEKLQAISRFNDDVPFLISTEAGGEGLNLHHACHVMVNYDLPWNPARLVQRMGRLYRYGQQETVIVFNLLADDGFDNVMLGTMLQRVDAIASDMAHVNEEFDSNLQAEILGEILENLDMVSILRQARDFNPQRTQAEVEEAIRKARQAQQLQDELLQHATSYDPSQLQEGAIYGMDHVRAFVRGMLPHVGIRLRQELHDGKVMELELPDELAQRIGEFGRKRVVRVTTDRHLKQRFADRLHLLDFESPFFRYLVEKACSEAFGGTYAAISLQRDDMPAGLLSGFRLRWQSDQGAVVHAEFAALFMQGDGSISRNPPFIPSLLLQPFSACPSAQPNTDSNTGERQRAIARLADFANETLKRESNLFRHPNDRVLLLAADMHAPGQSGGRTA